GCSLLVALTLVPSLAARVLRRAVRREEHRGVSAGIERGMVGLERGYEKALRGALRGPWFVVACAALLLAASIRLMSLVGLELMPETDEGEFDVDLEMPVGTPVERTTVVIRDIEQRVRAVLR